MFEAKLFGMAKNRIRHFVTDRDRLIGWRIRERREALGLRQTDLAKAIRVTCQQIQKYEGGINRVSASALYGIAAAMRVNIKYFYGDLGLRRGRIGTESAGAPSIGQPKDEVGGQARRLLMAFQMIRDPRQRTQIMKFAQMLAQLGGERPVE
jgi:transcriptional regulator with XRE-family HTH domain